MTEIDSDIKRPVRKAQPRISGQFYASGCSVAPRAMAKVKPGKWAKPLPKSVEAKEPLSQFMRRLNSNTDTKKARIVARSLGIPSSNNQ